MVSVQLIHLLKFTELVIAGATSQSDPRALLFTTVQYFREGREGKKKRKKGEREGERKGRREESRKEKDRDLIDIFCVTVRTMS